ncbi:PQQ-dependent sugar dehydrogenase [Pseudoxanthomonas sangjuensis]
MKTPRISVLATALLLAACGNADTNAGTNAGDATNEAAAPAAAAGTPAKTTANTGAFTAWKDPPAAPAVPSPAFFSHEVATFDEPWAMAFLPDGRLLVTEKKGRLKLYDIAANRTSEIAGVPAVDYGGQGGLGDVALHPQFAENHRVYLSYAEAGEGDTRGAALARAKLDLDADGNGGRLSDLQVIWRQVPKVTGQGHYSHRILFDRDGKLWLASGERQKFTPAQDMRANLGKVLRLNDDGTAAADNPFADKGGVTAQIWSLGHRNILGMAFDAQGRLWEVEHGPRGGDELNRVERGSNYGWPVVSWGNHYDGRDIPDHDTRPEFNAPEAWWNPVIAPAGFIIYSGDLFPYFKGNGFIGGLGSNSLVRIQFDGDNAREVERYDMGARIREVEQGPDGAIWLLQDGDGARLLKLTPAG